MPDTNHKTVVFICTGNFYRSRFSEYLFNSLAKKCGLQWRAISRRLEGMDGGAHEGPISEFAAYRLTAMGVPFDGDGFPFSFRRPTWRTPIWSSPSRRENTMR